jgi:hypothetical protein
LLKWENKIFKFLVSLVARHDLILRLVIFKIVACGS